jgi:hypothetical protein
MPVVLGQLFGTSHRPQDIAQLCYPPYLLLKIIE